MKLGWGFLKPIARKTNERFRNLRYSLHAKGGWQSMQHPGPRNGAAMLEAFPSSGNIAAPFLGPVFGPIFGTTKEQTGAARRSWQPGFRPFAGASLPSATQAAMDTLSGTAGSHANFLRSGSVPPLQRFCQEAVLRASWEKYVACTCCRASRPRALEYIIICGQSAKRDVIPYLHAGLRGVIGTYEGRNHRWEGRNPLFTCGLEGRNRDVHGA